MIGIKTKVETFTQVTKQIKPGDKLSISFGYSHAADTQIVDVLSIQVGKQTRLIVVNAIGSVYSMTDTTTAWYGSEARTITELNHPDGYPVQLDKNIGFHYQSLDPSTTEDVTPLKVNDTVDVCIGKFGATHSLKGTVIGITDQQLAVELVQGPSREFLVFEENSHTVSLSNAHVIIRDIVFK